jgi:SAM-dependent methyltransferase
MDNYQFCSRFALSAAGGLDGAFSVLDYGCGEGQIVFDLRAHQIEAYGCDVFYEASNYQEQIPAGMFGTVVRQMEGTKIPFADSSFDIVINNQVMEHVEDLDVALSEIRRVLKPGGAVLSLFPDRSIWREGHCGIPFLHWFPKGNSARIYYATALRACGMGQYKKDKSLMQWSSDVCEYLDRWTHYRSYDEIRAAFGRQFIDFEHIEADWLDRRLDGTRLRPLQGLLPPAVKRLVARKLAGMVFVCRRPSANALLAQKPS